jgi:hypothetical protein
MGVNAEMDSGSASPSGMTGSVPPHPARLTPVHLLPQGEKAGAHLPLSFPAEPQARGRESMARMAGKRYGLLVLREQIMKSAILKIMKNAIMWIVWIAIMIFIFQHNPAAAYVIVVATTGTIIMQYILNRK